MALAAGGMSVSGLGILEVMARTVADKGSVPDGDRLLDHARYLEAVDVDSVSTYPVYVGLMDGLGDRGMKRRSSCEGCMVHDYGFYDLST